MERHFTTESANLGTNILWSKDRRPSPVLVVFSIEPDTFSNPTHVWLIILSGDIETNPGPHTSAQKPKYLCTLCNKYIHKNAYSIRCNHNDTHWLHLKCTNTSLKTYKNKWKCILHTPKKQNYPKHISSNINSTKTDIPNKTSKFNNNSLAHTHSLKVHTNNNPNNANHNKNAFTILQLNINGISNKIIELTHLTLRINPNIILIQKSKLKVNHKTPNIPNYTPIRTDRPNNISGGGLITYINQNTNFTDITPTTTNSFIEHQLIQITLNNKPYHISNIYIPPKKHINAVEDTQITNFFTNLFQHKNVILAGDINAHSSNWYSPYTDNRGDTIQNIIHNSHSIIINTDNNTRFPIQTTDTQYQQPTSPDITAIPTHLLCNTTWETLKTLSSDHLPILTSIQLKYNKQRFINRTFTNFKKANWTAYTSYIETHIATHLPKFTSNNNLHSLNKALTKYICEADKLHIPKGNINTHNKHNPLPHHICETIKERDRLRKHHPTSTKIQNINKEIATQIRSHKTILWNEHINANWSHKHNSHTYWHTIKQLQNKSTHTDTNRNITFGDITKQNDKDIANAFNKQFTNITPKATHKTHRIINKQIKKLPFTPSHISTSDTLKALYHISHSKALGPDQISNLHLKHIGPKAIQLLTHIYNLALNNNTIPHTWKTSIIIPIPKPNKDKNNSNSYRPISLLSPIAKTLEKIILSQIHADIPNITHQHGFKKAHSTTTALHTIHNIIAEGFNKKKPFHRTITTSLDLSQAFDTLDIHTLIHKIINNTNINPLYTRFIAN